MRSRCGGGCCWRSKRPSARQDPARQRHLLTFVLIGGGPTGVELAGALAEIARHTLRREFDAIDPESARIVLIEAGDTILPSFPAVAARFGAPGAAQARRRSVGARAWSPAFDAEAVDVGADRLHGAHHHLGGRRRGLVARPVARRAARSRRPRDRRRRSVGARTIRTIFVAGDLASFHVIRRASRCRAWRRSPNSRGARRAQRPPPASPGEPTPAVPLPRSREHGDDRPRGRDRRFRLGARLRASSAGCCGSSSTSCSSSASAIGSRCCCSGRRRT